METEERNDIWLSARLVTCHPDRRVVPIILAKQPNIPRDRFLVAVLSDRLAVDVSDPRRYEYHFLRWATSECLGDARQRRLIYRRFELYSLDEKNYRRAQFKADDLRLNLHAKMADIG